MQSSKLPMEVCERVIDFLPIPDNSMMYGVEGDWIHVPTTISKRALYACALVCRDWLPRSQHHLLRHVELCTTHHADAFLDYLTRSPDRAQSVQFLSIRPLPPPSPPPPPRPSSSTAVPHSSTFSSNPGLNDWQSHEEKIVSQPEPDNGGDYVLKDSPKSPKSIISLRDQKQIDTERTHIPPCHYNWIYRILIRLPPLTNLSTLQLFALPTLHPSFFRLASRFKAVKALFLHDLSKQSFTEIIQLVNCLPQLKFLLLFACQWNRHAQSFPTSRLRLEKLNCFTLEGAEKDMLDWLGRLEDLSGLSALEFGNLTEPSDMVKLHPILQRCTHSLRYFFLDLELGDSRSDLFGKPCAILIAFNTLNSFWAEFLSLSEHSRLEYLRVGGSFSLSNSDHLSAFSSRISQLLPPSLVYLDIGTFDEPSSMNSVETLQSSWKVIDDALCEPMFNRLAYFVMTIESTYDEYFGVDRKTLQAILQAILPKCYQRGILWVRRYRITSPGQRRRIGKHSCLAKYRYMLIQLWRSVSCLRGR